MKVVVFAIGDKEYGVEIAQVQEVIRLYSIVSIPDAAAFVEGVMSLRGKIIALVNLRVKLGLKREELQKTNRIIITQLGAHMVGVVVDSVSGVIMLEPSAITAPDEVFKGVEYLSGVARAGKRLILMVDMARLLSHDAVMSIQKVHERIEVRKKSSL